MTTYQITSPDLDAPVIVEADTQDQAIEIVKLEHGEILSGDIEQIEN